MKVTSLFQDKDHKLILRLHIAKRDLFHHHHQWKLNESEQIIK